MKQAHCYFPDINHIPQQFSHKAPLMQNYYLSNGELRIWNGPLQVVQSPVFINTSEGLSRQILGSVPDLSSSVALEVLDDSVRAYANGRGIWPTMPVEKRIQSVKNFAGRLREKRDEIIKLLMWETGKSLREAESEFERAADYIRDTLTAFKELDRASSRFIIEKGIIGQIRRAPLGVVLCMGPYNFPLYETFTTLIPALIMGNTILMKPPRFGILIFQPILEAFRDCFPAGVINTIYGNGEEILPPLMASGKIDVLGFIGTHKVADALRAAHPRPHRLRCVLGLDAKNPAIVLPDADLEQTVAECLQGSLTFNGQRCTALKILFVHSSVVDSFLKLMSKGIEKLKCGMPWDTGVSITPLPEPEKPDYLRGLVLDAESYGAKVVNQGGGISNNSFFYPALLYPVSPEMRIYNEEQFGPVVPVVPFDDISEPIEYIVASNYGQQASIFGKDSDLLAQLLDALVNQVCRININSQCQRSPDSFPFNGRKNSADGTQSVTDALRIFSIRIVVAARENELNREIITDIVRERKSHFLSTDYIL